MQDATPITAMVARAMTKNAVVCDHTSVPNDATEAGGIESTKHEIIDDCALARRLKTVGGIWLGLTERAVSLRRYPKIGDIANMVSRSAYA